MKALREPLWWLIALFIGLLIGTVLLVGALILIPIILAYTAYAYWVFRGKVGDDGYH